MASLKVDLTELMRINTRSVEINQETYNVLSSWKQELENVTNNLDNATALGEATSRLAIAVENVMNTINTNFSKVNAFIEKQVNEYDYTQTEAVNYLNDLINSLNVGNDIN